MDDPGLALAIAAIVFGILGKMFIKDDDPNEEPRYKGSKGRRLRQLEQEVAAKQQEIEMKGLEDTLRELKTTKPTPRESLDVTIRNLEDVKRRIERELADPEIREYALNYVEMQIREALKRYADSAAT